MNHKLNKDLVYSLLSVTGMVPIMLTYNVMLEVGISGAAAAVVLKQIVPLFFVAFVVQKFVVSHNVFTLYRVIVDPQDPPLKHGIVMILLWVTGMCTLMSLYATLVSVGTENDFWRHYVTAVARNYPVALVAQAFVVGPLARSIHMRIFAPERFARSA